jgi:hypothetical protein
MAECDNCGTQYFPTRSVRVGDTWRELCWECREEREKEDCFEDYDTRRER